MSTLRSSRRLPSDAFTTATIPTTFTQVTWPQPTEYPFFPSFGSEGEGETQPLTVSGNNELLPVVDAPVESWSNSEYADVLFPKPSTTATTTMEPVIERLLGQAAQSPNNRVIKDRVRVSRPITDIGDTLAAVSRTRTRPFLPTNLSPPPTAARQRTFFDDEQHEQMPTDATTTRPRSTAPATKLTTPATEPTSTETTSTSKPTTMETITTTTTTKYLDQDSCEAVNCDFEDSTCGFEGTEGRNGAWTVVQGRVGDAFMGIPRAAFGNSPYM